MTLGWAEFPLAEVRAIRSTRGASVNDVMLTLLGGAVDAYAREAGEKTKQKFLRALVPVNVRVEEEKGDFGNRISVLPIDIPFGIADPLERLQAVTEYSQVMKNSSLSKGLDMVLTIPSLMPSVAQPLIWQAAPVAFSLLAHTWCTNVAGPQIPMYVMGHQLLHTYGYFPLNPSMGLACVITSYNQKISMTLIADAGIVPDVTELVTHLKDFYYSLRSAAKVPVTGPVTEPPKAETPRGESEVQRAEVNSPPVAESRPSQTSPGPAAGVKLGEAQPSVLREPPPATKGDVSIAGTVPSPTAAPSAVEADTQPASTTASLKEAVEAPSDRFSAVVEAESVAAPAIVAEAPSNGFSANAQVEPALLVLPVSPAVMDVVNHDVDTQPAVTNPSEKPKLFSEAWAQAYHDAINNNKAYYKASTRWEAGSLTFIMKASPRHGYVRDSAVWLDLHKGVCREAKSIQPEDAERQSAFVIEGDYTTWMDVLSGRVQPLVMIMRGKLRLKKGSITRLLPFTQSAQELIHSAQAISYTDSA
jgi:putative sterol carrier protein